MRRLSRILGSGLALVALAISLGRTGAAIRDDPRSWTLDHWIAWRDEQIRFIFEPDRPGQPISRQSLAERCQIASLRIDEILSKEPGFFEQGAGRALAMSHFVSFVLSQRRAALKDASGTPNYRYGMELSDREYWRAASADAQIPALLRSQPFLSCLTRPSGYQEAAAMIAAKNRDLPEGRQWQIVWFRSQFIRSVDRATYARMLILVPNEPTPDGGTIDRWVQFGIVAPGEGPSPDPRSVSVVSVRRSRDRTLPPKCFLVDYLRQGNPATGAIETIPTALSANDPSTACYACHKNGVVAIHPKVEYTLGPDGRLTTLEPQSPSAAATVDTLIRGYGKVELMELHPNDAGPTIGALADRINDDFIRNASNDADLSDESVDRIKADLTCVGCHEQQTKINYPLSMHTDADENAFESGVGLVQTYVESGWMPPGNTLSQTERHALWSCLMKAYYDPATRTGSLIEWLKGGP